MCSNVYFACFEVTISIYNYDLVPPHFPYFSVLAYPAEGYGIKYEGNFLGRS